MIKVQRQIEHLVKSIWLSQLVIVSKCNVDVRLCINMRNANTAIERILDTRQYSISPPTVDDLILKLKGTKRFTKLDLNSAFHQVELHKNSRYIAAF